MFLDETPWYACCWHKVMSSFLLLLTWFSQRVVCEEEYRKSFITYSLLIHITFSLFSSSSSSSSSSLSIEQWLCLPFCSSQAWGSSSKRTVIIGCHCYRYLLIITGWCRVRIRPVCRSKIWRISGSTAINFYKSYTATCRERLRLQRWRKSTNHWKDLGLGLRIWRSWSFFVYCFWLYWLCQFHSLFSSGKVVCK